MRVYVDRDRLPPTEDDEYYLDDLIGLEAVDETGAPAGIVAAVYNFGAGDLIELKAVPGVRGVRLIPFTREAVPAVELGAGRIQVARTAINDSASETNPNPDQETP